MFYYSKIDNICVTRGWITVESIVQCLVYNVDTQTHTLVEGNKVSVRAIVKSRCLHMALWLDVLFTSACQQHASSKTCQCDDHAHSTWSFSPTHIPRNSCLRYAKSVMQEKDFSVPGPQMIFTATNQRNWFCETGGHWNACLQAMFMPNPHFFAETSTSTLNLCKQKSLCCSVACRASLD